MEHKNRKTPCKAATYHCDGCHKGLANYQTLWKHKQKCQPRETRQEREIPTFDGLEFDGTRPKSTETMEKLRRFVQQRDGTSNKEQKRSGKNDANRLTNAYKNGEGLVNTIIENNLDKIAPSQKIHHMKRKESDEESKKKKKRKKDEEESEEEESDDEEPEKKKKKDDESDGKCKKKKKKKDDNDEEPERKKKKEEESDEEGSSEEDSSEGEPDEDNELYQLIHNTFDYVTEHDQQELMNLIEDFRSDVSVEFIDAVELLEELIEKYIGDEFLTAGDLVLSEIHDVMRRLQSSNLPKSKLIKLKLLVNDLEKNRLRINSILIRLNGVESEEQFLEILKNLIREELITSEQYEDLKDNFIAELPVIADIIRDTKIGQGLKFLPRSMKRLRQDRDRILNNDRIDSMKLDELKAIGNEIEKRRETKKK